MGFFAKLGAMIALIFAPIFGGFSFNHAQTQIPVIPAVLATTTPATANQAQGESQNGQLDSTFTWVPYPDDPAGTYIASNGHIIDTYVNEPVLGADPSTFVVSVGEPNGNATGVAKDKNNVYFTSDADSIVPGADPATFEVIADVNIEDIWDGYYAKDKNNVYFVFEKTGVNIIPGADPRTFEPVSDLSGQIDARDKSHTYSDGKIVQ
jgi:hypothetical protein